MKYDVHDDTERFLDVLYFARYFRKLKNKDIDELRQSPHYRKIMQKYATSLVDHSVHSDNISEFESALKYNIEVFNPLVQKNQQNGGASTKKKSYHTVQLLKIGKGKYKPIFHLGGSTAALARQGQVLQPTTKLPFGLEKARSRYLKPIRNAVKNLLGTSDQQYRPFTNLHENILDDFDKVKILPSSSLEYINDFCDKILEDRVYDNIAKYMPNILFEHKTNELQLGGSDDIIETENKIINVLGDDRTMSEKFVEIAKNTVEAIVPMGNIAGKYVYGVVSKNTRKIRAYVHSSSPSLQSGVIVLSKYTAKTLKASTLDLLTRLYLLQESLSKTKCKELYVIVYTQEGKLKQHIANLLKEEKHLSTRSRDLLKQLDKAVGNGVGDKHKILSELMNNSNTTYFPAYLYLILTIMALILYVGGQNVFTGGSSTTLQSFSVSSDSTITAGEAGKMIANSAADMHREATMYFPAVPNTNTRNHDEYAVATYNDFDKKISDESAKNIQVALDEKNIDMLHEECNIIMGSKAETYNNPGQVEYWGETTLRTQRILGNLDTFQDRIIKVVDTNFDKNYKQLFAEDKNKEAIKEITDLLKETYAHAMHYVEVLDIPAEAFLPKAVMDYFNRKTVYLLNVAIESLKYKRTGRFGMLWPIAQTIVGEVALFSKKYLADTTNHPRGEKHQQTLLGLLVNVANTIEMKENMIYSQTLRRLHGIFGDYAQTAEQHFRNKHTRLLALTSVAKLTLEPKNFDKFLEKASGTGINNFVRSIAWNRVTKSITGSYKKTN
jgi:hypothetical protein